MGVLMCLMKWKKDSVIAGNTMAVSVMEHILCAFKAEGVVHGWQSTQPWMGVVVEPVVWSHLNPWLGGAAAGESVL